MLKPTQRFWLYSSIIVFSLFVGTIGLSLASSFGLVLFFTSLLAITVSSTLYLQPTLRENFFNHSLEESEIALIAPPKPKLIQLSPFERLLRIAERYPANKTIYLFPNGESYSETALRTQDGRFIVKYDPNISFNKNDCLENRAIMNAVRAINLYKVQLKYDSNASPRIFVKNINRIIRTDYTNSKFPVLQRNGRYRTDINETQFYNWTQEMTETLGYRDLVLKDIKDCITSAQKDHSLNINEDMLTDEVIVQNYAQL